MALKAVGPRAVPGVMEPCEAESTEVVDRRSTWLPASSAAARRAATSIVVPKPSRAPSLEDREGRRCPICEGGPLRARPGGNGPPGLECPDCGATYLAKQPALRAARAPALPKAAPGTPDPHEADTWEPPTSARKKAPQARAAR